MNLMDAQARGKAFHHDPYDIVVEQTLLGSILKDDRLFQQASELIKPETFYDPLHGRIFETMSQMIELGGSIVTPVTLHAIMKSDPGVIEVGGRAYFDSLRSASPAIPNIKHYADILVDLATRRSLIRVAEYIRSAAYEPPTEKTSKEQIEEARAAFKVIEHEEAERHGAGLDFIDVRAWEGVSAPERVWQTHQRIPSGCTTLFSGNGGAGKTQLLQQLAVATVAGKDWLGVTPKQGPAIVLCCEDDAKEMHRRYERIAEHYGVSFSELADRLLPISMVGKDATLGTIGRSGLIEPTSLFRRLKTAVISIRPSLLVLDNAADVFAGNEIDRGHVRRFLTLCNELGYEGECGVVLSAHPSLNGMQSGSGISGSTGWHNSVRARAYLRDPKADAGEEVDPDERELEFKKSNYGPAGETIRLRWQNGLFLPVDPLHWIDKRAQAADAEEIFLKILTRFQREERNVSHQPTSPNYAPTVFSKEPEAKDRRVKKQALAGAMTVLFACDAIHVDSYGRPSRPAQRILLGAKP